MIDYDNLIPATLVNFAQEKHKNSLKICPFLNLRHHDL